MVPFPSKAELRRTINFGSADLKDGLSLKFEEFEVDINQVQAVDGKTGDDITNDVFEEINLLDNEEMCRNVYHEDSGLEQDNVIKESLDGVQITHAPISNACNGLLGGACSSNARGRNGKCGSLCARTGRVGSWGGGCTDQHRFTAGRRSGSRHDGVLSFVGSRSLPREGLDGAQGEQEQEDQADKVKNDLTLALRRACHLAQLVSTGLIE